MVVAMMRLLNARPRGRIALGRWELSAKSRTPFRLVAPIKLARIERAKGIAADSLSVFKDETQIRLELKIGSDVDAAQSVRIIAVKWLAILAIVTGLETNVISAGLVARSGAADRAGGHAPIIDENRGGSIFREQIIQIGFGQAACEAFLTQDVRDGLGFVLL